MPHGKRLLVLALILILLVHPLPVSGDSPELSILVLHSYNIDFQWTQDQHSAFSKTLEDSGIRATYSIEFMDTKKYPGTLNDKAFAESALSKYGKRRYDLIYTTDNDALNFLLKYRDSHFSKVPVVASGINMTPAIASLPEAYHIVFEQPDFNETLKLIRLLQPDVRHIHVVNDTSTSGRIFKTQILSETAPAFPELTFHWVENLSRSALPAYFSRLGPEDAVMLSIYFTDGISETYTDREISRLIVANTKVPVWCNWDFHLNSGVLGGHLVSGETQGRRAGQLAAELLKTGSAPSRIYDTALLNQSRLDYPTLQQLGLSTARLPSEVQLINRPTNYLEENRTLLIIFTAVVTVLLLIIAGLARINRDHRLIQAKNQELLTIKSAVIRDQKEIVFRMGELIENRSHDTGNHVRRVALISRLLGTHLGLSEEELQELETAAPMHDVGKIGIPEEILSKPGRLDAEERRLMEQHTTLGHEIFHGSDLSIFQTAAIISHQHHEHWSGKGYPLGLSGEEIHTYARIVAAADVFDALLSRRVYKEPWPPEEVIAFFKQQSGAMFDPRVAALVEDLLPELLRIRAEHQDHELADNMCPL